MKTLLGIIGGSGLYELAGLANPRTEWIASSWGEPSAPLTFGSIGKTPTVFLPRHGVGHRLGPSQVNYRANIDALKRAGATDILSVSACGSFRQELAPGTFVIVDQFIDATYGRQASFFGEGCVAHAPMANPVSGRLSDLVARACAEEGVAAHCGGVYLAIEGPQFATRAESRLRRSWGCDVVGMTNMPEARLAREAELPYATLAMVTDYDSWRDADASVVAVDALAVLRANVGKAGLVIAGVARALGADRAPDAEGLDTILDISVVTEKASRDPDLIARLDAIAGRFLRAEASR